MTSYAYFSLYFSSLFKKAAVATFLKKGSNFFGKVATISRADFQNKFRTMSACLGMQTFLYLPVRPIIIVSL